MNKFKAFLTMSKSLDIIILMIQKNLVPNFLLAAINRLIYLKSGPKLSCNPRNIGLHFYWSVIF